MNGGNLIPFVQLINVAAKTIPTPLIKIDLDVFTVQCSHSRHSCCMFVFSFECVHLATAIHLSCYYILTVWYSIQLSKRFWYNLIVHRESSNLPQITWRTFIPWITNFLGKKRNYLHKYPLPSQTLELEKADMGFFTKQSFHDKGNRFIFCRSKMSTSTMSDDDW